MTTLMATLLAIFILLTGIFIVIGTTSLIRLHNKIDKLQGKLDAHCLM